MRFALKATAVLVAATALLGAGAGIASASTTDGFVFTNSTTEDLELMQVVGDPSTDFESMPAIHSILAPGQSVRFEMYFRAAHEDADQIYYMNSDGATFSAAVTVDSANDADVMCYTGAGQEQNCTDTLDHAAQVWYTNFLDPEETDTFDSSQPDRQRYWVDELCSPGAAATCTFRPRSMSQYDGPSREASGSFTNNGDVAVSTTLNGSDTVKLNDPLGLDPKVMPALEAGIKAKYGWELPITHEFDVSQAVKVPAHSKAWFDDAPPMFHLAGTFTMKMGNTTIIVPDLTFEFPNSTLPGSWDLLTRPVNGGPAHTTQIR